MFEKLTPVSILIAASYIVASVILICLIHIILKNIIELAFDTAGVNTQWPQTNVFIGEKTGTPQDINRRKNID